MTLDVEKYISRKTISILTIFILALQYASYINFNFVEADYARLYMAKYHFSLYNVFIDQFFNGFFYRPLTNGLLYKLFYELAGENPAYYRYFILFIFLLNTLLVYELTLLLCHAKYMALIAALFYVTRTAFAQTVVCISAGFEDPVVIFFILSAFVAYVRYTRKRSIVFYIIALFCAVMGILSRESAVVIPLIVVMVECSCLKGLNVRHLVRVFIRVVPFSLVAACPLIRMTIDTFFSRSRAGFYGSSSSVHTFFENTGSLLLYSFNSMFELYAALIFIVMAFGALRHAARWKVVLAYACGTFLIGLVPYISLAGGLSPYYVSISAIGIAVLFSLGFKNSAERFPAVRPILITGLVALLVLSSFFSMKTTKNIKSLLLSERISSHTIEVMKSEFPTLPEESLVYIENSTIELRWALQNQWALRFAYNDTVTIFYEGSSQPARLPASCSEIYVFSWENYQMHFKKHISGADLQRFLTEKGF